MHDGAESSVVLQPVEERSHSLRQQCLQLRNAILPETASPQTAIKINNNNKNTRFTATNRIQPHNAAQGKKQKKTKKKDSLECLACRWFWEASTRLVKKGDKHADGCCPPGQPEHSSGEKAATASLICCTCFFFSLLHANIEYLSVKLMYTAAASYSFFTHIQ